MPEDMLLTTGEAAQMVRVHQETVRKWIKRGQLAAVRLPGGTYKVWLSEIEKLLEGGHAA